jgi:hypothetical protein
MATGTTEGAGSAGDGPEAARARHEGPVSAGAERSTDG